MSFSVITNRYYTHSICKNKESGDNRWLGVTFRKSKSLNPKFRIGQMYVKTIKSVENKVPINSGKFDMGYTVSPGDIYTDA